MRGPTGGHMCPPEHQYAEPIVNRRPQLEIVAPNASPDEAAAVVAALERFMRDLAPPPAPAREVLSPWLVDALNEGVSRQPETPLPWA